MISCLWLIVTNTTHFIMVITDWNNGIYNALIDDAACIFSCFGLILLSLVLILFRVKNSFIIAAPSLIGTFGIFYLIWHVKNKDLPNYMNPMSLLFNYISLPLFCFIVANFYKQTYFILCGITTKQYDSILVYKNSPERKSIKGSSNLTPKLSLNGEIYLKQIEGLSIKNKFKNFINFCVKPKSRSLVVNN
jgi:hypothetical protein